MFSLEYLGNDINILSLEAMKNMFEIATTNLKMAQEKRDPTEMKHVKHVKYVHSADQYIKHVPDYCNLDVNTWSFAGKRKYNICGTSLHMNITTTNSSNDTIICSASCKT